MERKLRGDKLMICTRQHILFRWSKQGQWVGRGWWYVWSRGEVHTGVLMG